MLLLPHQATAPRSPFHLGARCGGTPHHHVDTWAGGAPPRHTLPLLMSRRRPNSATHVISTGHHEDAGPLLLAAPCPTRATSLFFTSGWTQTPFLLVSMWRAARDAVPLPLCFGAALTRRPVHQHDQHCGLVARLSTCRGPWRGCCTRARRAGRGHRGAPVTLSVVTRQPAPSYSHRHSGPRWPGALTFFSCVEPVLPRGIFFSFCKSNVQMHWSSCSGKLVGGGRVSGANRSTQRQRKVLLQIKSCSEMDTIGV